MSVNTVQLLCSPSITSFDPLVLSGRVLSQSLPEPVVLVQVTTVLDATLSNCLIWAPIANKMYLAWILPVLAVQKLSLN